MALRFSSNPADFNLKLIVQFLIEESYWAKGRSPEKIANSIANSFCLAAFLKEQQVGFIRVVTDYETHAYIMDAFVIAEYRGRGIGTQLMEHLLKSRELSNVSKLCLRTTDAEGFYTQLGFVPSDNFLVLNKT